MQRAVLPLFAATLILSAFALFAVQPLFTKMVLPLLGGTPGVWNTAMVFFQALLLGGYLYAHLSTKYLKVSAQIGVHLILLAAVFLFLPLRVPAGWAPPADANPIPWLVGLLTIAIGLPFFVVSSTAPLLQRWFTHTEHAASGDPYFLYSGSNLGSLAALLSYPVLIEPFIGLRAQGIAWSIAYAVLAAGLAACAWLLWRNYTATAHDDVPAPSDEALPAVLTWRMRGHWLLLALAPSALMLGVTLHISTDVASMPLLWIAPLTLYLLTFVIAFARRPILPMRAAVIGAVIFVALLAALLNVRNLYVLLFVNLGAFFFSALVCHLQLVRRRPSARHLTEFYLWMSLGGVLGGFFAAIVAPLVFPNAYEYPLALVLALALRPAVRKPGWAGWALDIAMAVAVVVYFALIDYTRVPAYYALSDGFAAYVKFAKATAFPDLFVSHDPDDAANLLLVVAFVGVLVAFGLRPRGFALAAGAALLIAPPYLAVPQMRVAGIELFPRVNQPLHQERSFFGVHTVERWERPGGMFNVLKNGTTTHGAEASLDLTRKPQPITYYFANGTVRRFFRAAATGGFTMDRVAVLGLGTGTISCYLAPAKEVTFFEIDPVTERIARDPRYFNYLADCGAHPGVVLGDGRLNIAKVADASLDLIVLDAFSSDAIPVHLLTREAFNLYLQKLRPGGVILVHITNQYIDLRTTVAAMLADRRMAGFSLEILGRSELMQFGSYWVATARAADDLAFLERSTQPWAWVDPEPSHRVWTDDYSNVVSAMRWGDFGWFNSLRSLFN